EYVHTQQKGEAHNLLGQAIKEGACDFITELVMGKPLQNNYIVYGRQHETELKASFKLDMFSPAYRNWLYNGTTATTVADLGYFMGYDICKAYYTNSPDKKKGIKEIIELNYSDTTAVENFLANSKYYTEPINKQELIQQFQAKIPYVVRLEPFTNGDISVDAATKEIKIVFSAPMNKKGYSISFGERGKDYFPIAGVVGFSDDGTSFTLNLDLKPGHEYEFIITDRSFKSVEGYPLKPYEVKFKTK
ncbi:MAG TPA: Ig-like domain-containing protein, partial [Flavisolibacter sp.]|nr:Ig-like domain-containing protein [Flavisolibacter sp.]